jgi:hypothetical protein
MYRLHYSRIDAKNEDIPCFTFKKVASFIDFIDEHCIRKSGEVVWCLLKTGHTDAFISESQLSIQDFIQNKYCWNVRGDFHLFECDSFEEAYKIALSNAEVSELCYSE